ncbi:TPA: ead/Ea22-like family protein [Escherichia coli]|uniref:ead/Ea22-like family protein n=1 Tax=Escherichia coli TaxID=562 RepID=UPI0019C78482|nr:ead/Ea22-like family protein [Escherichia coli]MCZ6945962.1 ead/Ea22-like family protein [Escherichia coli]HAL1848453.1 ead/Ea22-like family protein [Escherichia coli]HAL2142530.1 ead/Ea22-like family protein [Escherichia coli]HAL2143688.1 ead/Ea22-like family protein [Escherichia coli]
MNKIDYQALREAAEKATCGVWSLEYGEERFDAGDALIHREVAGYIPICRIEGAHPESGFDEDFQIEQQANAEFIAAANPATVTALLDELERNQQYIKRRDQENEEIALTVGRLRVELEGKDSKIANLTAERDALREGEIGDARHSNTRAAADIYFQLVEECEIPAGGSLVEYVDDMREKLEAAEKRIAELEAREIKPAKGEVLVVVSGFTGCGKSAIAGEIEIAMKAIGVPVQWTNGDAEKHMTGADWLTAIEMYKPTVRIVEVNVPRAAGIRIKGE